MTRAQYRKWKKRASVAYDLMERAEGELRAMADIVDERAEGHEGDAAEWVRDAAGAVAVAKHGLCVGETEMEKEFPRTPHDCTKEPDRCAMEHPQ